MASSVGRRPSPCLLFPSPFRHTYYFSLKISIDSPNKMLLQSAGPTAVPLVAALRDTDFVCVRSVGAAAPLSHCAIAHDCAFVHDQTRGRAKRPKAKQKTALRNPFFTGPTDCNRCNCNHKSFQNLCWKSIGTYPFRLTNKMWLQLQWFKVCWPYGQFSTFHVCFCGLDPGNLKFETVRTHKQHVCF